MRKAQKIRGVIGAMVLAATLALAACNTAQTVSPTAAEGARIAFESIDGPPRAVSSRLARTLDEEATGRRLVVVARGGQADYLIRGYLAVNAEGSAASIAWAFDVYDAERRRAFRLRGEEPAPGTSSWGTVNDALLQRIASSSVTQLMTLIAGDRAPGAAVASSGSPIWSGLVGGGASGATGTFAAAPPTVAEGSR
jgi:hypothetical protein